MKRGIKTNLKGVLIKVLKKPSEYHAFTFRSDITGAMDAAQLKKEGKEGGREGGEGRRFTWKDASRQRRGKGARSGAIRRGKGSKQLWRHGGEDGKNKLQR